MPSLQRQDDVQGMFRLTHHGRSCRLRHGHSQVSGFRSGLAGARGEGEVLQPRTGQYGGRNGPRTEELTNTM